MSSLCLQKVKKVFSLKEEQKNDKKKLQKGYLLLDFPLSFT
jgi:hypothetical protein